jgi:hypothetical protein
MYSVFMRGRPYCSVCGEGAHDARAIYWRALQKRSIHEEKTR